MRALSRGLAPGPKHDQPVAMLLGGLVAFVLTTFALVHLKRMGVDYPQGTALVALFGISHWVQRRILSALERADLEIAMRGDATR